MAKKKSITERRDHMGTRLAVLDELLGSPRRRSYSELLKALNSKLYELGEEQIRDRTLKYDISHLVENKSAPIHRPTRGDNRVYYTNKFSLKTIPIDEDDISQLTLAIAILKKVTDIQLTSEVDAIVARLQNRIHTRADERADMIAFEEHTEAKGKEYLDRILSAIKEKCPIKFIYKPFGKPEREWLVHPYMLKQYRSRWFLIGRVGNNKGLSNIRLDSIKGKIKNSAEPFIENNLFDPGTYFRDVIGVTIPQDEAPMEITIKVSKVSADYIRTKPLHNSQIIKKEYIDGSMLLQLKAFNNYELRAVLLSYGPELIVKKPEILQMQLMDLYKRGFELYQMSD